MLEIKQIVVDYQEYLTLKQEIEEARKIKEELPKILRQFLENNKELNLSVLIPTNPRKGVDFQIKLITSKELEEKLNLTERGLKREFPVQNR